MKKALTLLCAISIAAPMAFAAEMSTTETTTTGAGGAAVSTSSTSTTTGAGTVTTFTPGSAIMVKTESAADPVSYQLSEKVTYVTAEGTVVEPSMIKAGVPVTVHYIKEGDRMVADRVVVSETTTTTTTE